ncbi:MAG: biopolymer transporter ExbD [Gammaproteobacteria bacterium]|nr:biopolymer transporter ExbD [Gammaproteobacteria bacterium]
MRLQRRRADEPEINLTSLIDVVFLLLIFFMVASTFERETQLSVELPESSGAAIDAEGNVVEVTIDAQGRYYVNKQEVVNTRLDSLMRAMQSAAGETAQPKVILSADRKTAHEAVVQAMDAAGQLGYLHITIATAKPDE